MIAKVIIDISTGGIDRTFDYLIPPQFGDVFGYRVAVPFAEKYLVGFVIGVSENSDYDPDKLKEVIDVLDDYPILSREHCEIMDYLRRRFNLRYIDIIRLFMPSAMRKNGMSDKKIAMISLNTLIPHEVLIASCGRSQKRKDIVEYLREGRVAEITLLNKLFGNENVKYMIAHNLVEVTDSTVRRAPHGMTSEKKNVNLTNSQRAAVDAIVDGAPNTYLLFGVTGSGKTEVYLNCIRKVLAKGKSVIVLAPEISLTPQLLSRFRSEFGDDAVAMQHSGLNDRERYDEWRRIYTGEARVVIGARSAVFAPVRNLGLIVVDEEHDGSYSSESNPRYSAIDVARFRAMINDCSCVLGSATPKLESYRLALAGEYKLLNLPERAGSAGLPSFSIVDMTEEVMRGNMGVLSMLLIKELRDCLSRGEQAMVFLNRRGYASFVRCRKCGYIPKCEDCDVSLTYHAEDDRLKCHYCNRRYKMPEKCPACGGSNLKYGRIGTERVVQEIAKLFPDITLLRMDNDTTGEKDAYLKILSAFREHKADVLVGTQMIAKGHDFPNVTLVGVVDADVNLYAADYRSSERTYQLITQVAGRAGRAEKSGKVVIQTYFPRHYVFRYAINNDYVGFYKREINIRETAAYPPFTGIIRILVTSMDEDVAMNDTRVMYEQCKVLKDKKADAFVYLQAMRSPLARMEKKFRYQILMRVRERFKDEIAQDIFGIAGEKHNKNSNVFVELDPQNLS